MRALALAIALGLAGLAVAPWSASSATAQQAGAPADWTAPWTEAEIDALGFALSEAWTHGLDPADYVDPRWLAGLPSGPERDSAARSAWFDYAEDLAFGRIDPRLLDADWTATVRDQDLMAWYQRAREGLGVYEALEQLAPAHPDYAALRAELIRLTTLPARPTLVPPGPPLALGQSGPRVDALRARLFELGLLESPGGPGQPFDARLQSAVMRFQSRHRLAADGEAGASTLAELNAGEQRRVDQLRANLERWRWVAADLGARHVRVNIAGYRLEAWADGRVDRVHDVMIGTVYASTPVFSEDMTIVEINPWWYTPGGLGSYWVRTFRTNPGFAYANGFRLVDLDTGRQVPASQADWANGRYRVIQAPGPTNSMGRVKFLFPNHHNVYIHDTPHRDLFANVQRDDSSGCVRVRDPEDFAVWVLAGEGWVPDQVRAAFDSGETVRVRLENPVPVHILYFTAEVDAFGEVRFLHDIYGRDPALIDALNGRSPIPAPEGDSAPPDPNAAP